MNPCLLKPDLSRSQTVPDALIAWTSAAGLVSFGIIFLDDAVIMGRTILALGVLIAANEALKLHAMFAGAKHGYQRLRLAVAFAFVALVIFGFFTASSAQ